MPRRLHAALCMAALLFVVAFAGACGGVPTQPTPPPTGGGPTEPPPPPPPEEPTPPPPSPTLTRTRFLAFGDSMTEGRVSISAWALRLDAPQSYPSKLAGLLGARYTAQTITVVNAGQGGERASDGVRRLPRELAAAGPEVVLLMQGANDLNAFGESAIQATVNALEDMVREAQRAGVAPFVASLPPQRPGGSRAGATDFLTTFNGAVERMAAVKGATFVDVFGAFGGDLSLIGADGLHPTEAGYERIAQAFFDAIKAAGEAPPSQAAR